MISIVLPCYEEERRLGPSLEAMLAWLPALAEPWEIVVVDDGSRDRTSAVARGFAAAEPRVRVERSQVNRGKGEALRHGFRAARGEWVLFCDADLATPIEHLAAFRAEGERGADVVIASRVAPGARILTPQPFRRRLAGAVFRGLVRGLGLTPFGDTQCGFKLLRRSRAASVLEAVERAGFAFDVELLLRAERAGLVVRELAVDWRDARGSKLRLWPDAARMLRDLVAIRLALGARRASRG